jgi:hypothetical protein
VTAATGKSTRGFTSGKAGPGNQSSRKLKFNTCPMGMYFCELYLSEQKFTSPKKIYIEYFFFGLTTWNISALCWKFRKNVQVVVKIFLKINGCIDRLDN